MKIQYITHEYGDRWVKYAYFLKELGHEVDLIRLKDKKTPGQVTIKNFKSQYDIVWVFAADYIWYKVLTDEFIEAIKNDKAVFIGYCTINTVFPFKQWVNNFKVFDTCFIHSKLVTNMAEDEGLDNVIYMPYGFDRDEYFRIKKRKKFNISFMGSPQTNCSADLDERVQLLNALKPFKVRVFGERFKGLLDKSIKVSSFSTHKHMNIVFNQSKINLNIPLINSMLPELRGKCHPKNRFYEIPGSGNFMLSGYDDEFNEQFEDRVHCAYYKNFDFDDLCNNVEYYLSHDQEREEIAEAGYQHALKNHQTRFRFQNMMDIITRKHF